MRITRIAAAAVTVAALTLAGAGAASADPSTSPSGSVTITLSPDQVQFLCDKRLPKVDQRVDKLIERINGGADVRGSVAWLKAKADEARKAGKNAEAQKLDERATKRAGRVDELNKIKGWAADFRSKYCGAK